MLKYLQKLEAYHNNYANSLTETRWIRFLVLSWITAFLAKGKSGASYLDPKDLHATLLPTVTLTVSAFTANLFILDLPTLSIQIVTMFVSYIIWSNGISLATSLHYFLVSVLVYSRMN